MNILHILPAFVVISICTIVHCVIIYEGELIVLTSHTKKLDIPLIWLKINDKDIRPLILSNKSLHNEYRTGDIVRVHTTLVPDTININTIHVPIYGENVEMIFQQTPLPPNDVISSITFVMNICESDVIPVKNVTDLWFKNPSKNLKEYFHSCSFGKVKFDNSSNIIVGPIDVPCQSNTIYGGFDSRLCNSESIYGWMKFAETYAKDVLHIEVENYKSRIAILSDVPCVWAGLGTVGCGSTCYTWIIGKYATLPIVFHELGHNFGLLHSTENGYEYGDKSCAMAIQEHPICFNAAHNWMLGWSLPILKINVNTEKENNFTIRIPSSQKQVINFVQISHENYPEMLYISYRTKTGYDEMIDDKFDKQILIHSSLNTPPLPEYKRTILLFHSSALKTSYHDSIMNLTIRLKSVHASHCIIKIYIN